ncbi:DUF397 domain-containing protein [Actinomadura coerulea]|uniref:DUF397 domain-containing protein n=1 Tax=Actinomadura coerulea TaxID=46159 RepID=UPI00343DF934
MSTLSDQVVRGHRSDPRAGNSGQDAEVDYLRSMLASQGQMRTYSDSSGAEGLEGAFMFPVSTQWRKSSKSDDTGGACVEVADLASAVAVRDSKDPDGPKLVFGAAAWEAFASRVKGGHLDLI